MEAIDSVHRRMAGLLAVEEALLDGIYVCPHTPEDGCGCRNRATKMVQRAVSDHQFDLATTFVIGDKLVDIELGRNVGAVTFLVRTGDGAQVVAEGGVNADYVVDDLPAVARIIETLMIAKNGSVVNARPG